MDAMKRLLQSRSIFGMFWLALGLSLSLSCARSEPAQRTGASSPGGGQALPFHPDTDNASAGDGAHPAVSPDPKPATGLPFRSGLHPRVLPAGTLLTVQLENSLSTTTVHAGDSFTASVAAPLTMDGDTLIARGSAVTGCVESMQSLAAHPGLTQPSGYFRLTLNAIDVEGRPVALQTSSLFARGTSQPPSILSSASVSDRSDGVRVQKGRRLTFRLTAPVTLNDANSVANRQSLGSTIE
jgi:hypothetical protein